MANESWFSISVIKLGTSGTAFNGYFSVDTSSKIVKKFCDNLNPGINLLNDYQNNYGQGSTFEINSFSLNGAITKQLNITGTTALNAIGWRFC